MKQLGFVLMITGALFACGGKKGNEAYDKTKAFADQMCECKDAACAKKVTDEMTKWSQEYSKNLKPEDMVPDEAEAKKYQEVSKRMTDCAMKANGTK